MAGGTATAKGTEVRRPTGRSAPISNAVPDIGTKVKDMVQGIPTKGRAVIEMTVKSIIYDRKTLIFFALSLILLAIPIYWAYTWEPSHPNGIIMFVIVAMVIYLQFIVLYACMLFGTSVIAEEEEHRTITYLTSRPISNFEIVLYKYIGFVCVTFAMFIVPLLLNFAIICTHTPYEQTSDFLFELGQFVGLLFVAIAAWGALFMLMGVVLKKYALLAGLLYAIFWETFIANIPTTIRYATIGHYVRSLSPFYVSFGGDDPATHTEWYYALVAMIGLSIACIILSWYFQRGKDYN